MFSGGAGVSRNGLSMCEDLSVRQSNVRRLPHSSTLSQTLVLRRLFTSSQSQAPLSQFTQILHLHPADGIALCAAHPAVRIQ